MTVSAAELDGCAARRMEHSIEGSPSRQWPHYSVRFELIECWRAHLRWWTFFDTKVAFFVRYTCTPQTLFSNCAHSRLRREIPQMTNQISAIRPPRAFPGKVKKPQIPQTGRSRKMRVATDAGRALCSRTRKRLLLPLSRRTQQSRKLAAISSSRAFSGSILNSGSCPLWFVCFSL